MRPGPGERWQAADERQERPPIVRPGGAIADEEDGGDDGRRRERQGQRTERADRLEDGPSLAAPSAHRTKGAGAHDGPDEDHGLDERHQVCEVGQRREDADDDGVPPA